MYTAPPSGDENDEEARSDLNESADAPERETADTSALGETTGTTDANWTGTVPADD